MGKCWNYEEYVNASLVFKSEEYGFKKLDGELYAPCGQKSSKMDY